MGNKVSCLRKQHDGSDQARTNKGQLRPINIAHVVHQIGGVLCNPPTTKHGGSSSSTLVMITGHFPYIPFHPVPLLMLKFLAMHSYYSVETKTNISFILCHSYNQYWLRNNGL